MKLGNLELVRDTYTLKSTTGKLYVDAREFCYTLEDVVRGENIKIPAQTALPSGKYMVILTMSSRFKRVMPMIFTQANGHEARQKGISFKGARFHGGNDHTHTEGCPLIAYNKLSDDLIQGTAEKDLTRELMGMGLKEQSLPLPTEFDYVGLEIINK